MTHKTEIKNESSLHLTPAMRMLLRVAITRTLARENMDLCCEVSVLLTSNDGIRKLNEQYRSKDVPTDVLSFPMYDSLEELRKEAALSPDAEYFALGDVIIAPDVVAKEANLQKQPFDKHLCRMCVHSVLHLLGYDHELGPEDEAIMFEKQEAIVDSLFKN